MGRKMLEVMMKKMMKMKTIDWNRMEKERERNEEVEEKRKSHWRGAYMIDFETLHFNYYYYYYYHYYY